MVYHKTIPQVELKTSRGGGLVFYREITGGLCIFPPKKMLYEYNFEPYLTSGWVYYGIFNLTYGCFFSPFSW